MKINAPLCRSEPEGAPEGSQPPAGRAPQGTHTEHTQTRPHSEKSLDTECAKRHKTQGERAENRLSKEREFAERDNVVSKYRRVVI